MSKMKKDPFLHIHLIGKKKLLEDIINKYTSAI